MAKLSATVTFTYGMNEEGFPGGINKSDIKVEQDILLKLLEKSFADNFYLTDNLEVMVKLDETA